MNNYEFNVLKTNEQAAYTWKHGTYLAARNEKYFAINLYHLDKFYVEVWYNHEEVCVNKIRSFRAILGLCRIKPIKQKSIIIISII